MLCVLGLVSARPKDTRSDLIPSNTNILSPFGAKRPKGASITNDTGPPIKEESVRHLRASGRTCESTSRELELGTYSCRQCGHLSMRT